MIITVVAEVLKERRRKKATNEVSGATSGGQVRWVRDRNRCSISISIGRGNRSRMVENQMTGGDDTRCEIISTNIGSSVNRGNITNIIRSVRTKFTSTVRGVNNKITSS